MAELTRDAAGFDRRDFLTAALAGAGALALGTPAWASFPARYPAIRKAAEDGREAAIKRIQDWIAHPAIAAENLNMKEGAEYMANLAREAGFDATSIVPTDGHPGVFATMDNGAICGGVDQSQSRRHRRRGHGLRRYVLSDCPSELT
ncbi:MAG TPA: twin-arginine translocation signal domain-containing protein [Steroidobacter sp.]|nr:twin-arginine translocation signal domain-containing protein [Steroidobacter sp.]